jgi:ubiquinone/menaquinone biosynthesis C-methylase UbiE
MNEDHLNRIREEFERQSGTFAAWAERLDMDMGERFRTALGDARTGRILDVACGPGVVTAAVASEAAEVVGLDATEAMLDRARKRAEGAGLSKVSFTTGNAESLPFDDNSFDGVVNRAALHHFENPAAAVNEMFRVLKPGGQVVLVDVVSSESPEKSTLHNALEILRDPSHIRMMPASEIDRMVAEAGFGNPDTAEWVMERELGEWLEIANDTVRTGPLTVVMGTLAASGHDAGIDLRNEGGKTIFRHYWHLVAAKKP